MKHVVVVSDQLIAKRRSEKFKRVKTSTLAKLLGQQHVEESIYQLNKDGGHGEIHFSDSVSQTGPLIYGGSVASRSPTRADAESVVSQKTGVSAVSAVTYATEMLGITAQTQFLLLDLRDPEEYELWRIKEAINFPAPNIARDKVIPELYRFKNAPDKLIIIYMNDERQGTQYAQILAEKGYENVFLLSGGIEAFLEDFSELVEGKQVPMPKRKVEGKRSFLIACRK